MLNLEEGPRERPEPAAPVVVDHTFPPRDVKVRWTPLPLPISRRLYTRFNLVHRGPGAADYWRRVEHVERGTVLGLAYSRYFDCPCYEGCLALACREDWSGFTCDACYGFKLALQDPKAWPPRSEGPVTWTQRDVQEAARIDPEPPPRPKKGKKGKKVHSNAYKKAHPEEGE